MIALLLLATASTAPTATVVPSIDQQRFEACTALAESDPVRALDQAGAWRVNGGGLLARHCEALAYVAQRRWVPAATRPWAICASACSTSAPAWALSRAALSVCSQVSD